MPPLDGVIDASNVSARVPIRTSGMVTASLLHAIHPSMLGLFLRRLATLAPQMTAKSGRPTSNYRST